MRNFVLLSVSHNLQFMRLVEICLRNFRSCTPAGQNYRVDAGHHGIEQVVSQGRTRQKVAGMQAFKLPVNLFRPGARDGARHKTDRTDLLKIFPEEMVQLFFICDVLVQTARKTAVMRETKKVRIEMAKDPQKPGTFFVIACGRSQRCNGADHMLNVRAIVLQIMWTCQKGRAVIR